MDRSFRFTKLKVNIGLELQFIHQIDLTDIYITVHPDFPVGTVHKSPSADAGDMGLIPGPGRFHMLQGN